MLKIKANTVFSPLSYLALLWILFILSPLENPLGWNSEWRNLIWDQLLTYILFTICFVLGFILCPQSKRTKNTSKYFIISKQILFRYKVMYWISVGFMMAKFINIGQIPLLGDPLSRYDLTLGGFEDFPARLIFPLGLVAAYFAIELKQKKYYFYFFLSFLLPTLLMQRQDTFQLLIGAFIFVAAGREYSIKKIVVILISIIFLLVVIIGLGALVRFGSDSLQIEDKGVLSMALWILHGEICSVNLFSAYVAESMGEDQLNGLYTLASYLSIFIPNFTMHGAEYIRVNYTSAATAQSISAPISYYVDFGYIGVCIYGILIGLVSAFLYKKYKERAGMMYSVTYIAYFMQLLWSVRSGVLPMSTILVYQILAMIFIFSERKKYTVTLAVAVPLFLLTLVPSFIFLAIRI